MKKLSAQVILTVVTSSLLASGLISHAFAQTTPETTTTTITPTVTTTNTTSIPGVGRTTTKMAAPTGTTRSTAMQAKRQAFMEKVATIKDTQKKMLVEKIDSKASDINKKKTAQMSQALTRMNAIVTELSTKSALAKEQGQSTVKLNTAITTAQAAIKTAEAAVEAQMAKEYTPTITTEATLKTTVGATIKTLQTDLRNTHAAVANAKQKVILAIVELKTLNGNPSEKPASNSANNTLE